MFTPTKRKSEPSIRNDVPAARTNDSGRPGTAIATDDEGYGMTYLFTPGQVTVADTKQGLLLIEWPKS